MLRVLFVSTILLAMPGPALADDMDTCRGQQGEAKDQPTDPKERQANAKARFDACEKVVASGQASGKDLGLANYVRGQWFRGKHNSDKAISAFDAAYTADPNKAEYLTFRGLAHEEKGDDDHAMADYNQVLQTHPKAGRALYNRGTLYLRKGALQSALVTSMRR